MVVQSKSTNKNTESKYMQRTAALGSSVGLDVGAFVGLVVGSAVGDAVVGLAEGGSMKLGSMIHSLGTQVSPGYISWRKEMKEGSSEVKASVTVSTMSSSRLSLKSLSLNQTKSNPHL